MSLNVSCSLNRIIQTLCILQVTTSKIITRILIITGITGIQHVHVALERFLRSLHESLSIRTKCRRALLHIIQLELSSTKRTRPTNELVFRSSVILNCECEHRKRCLIRAGDIHNNARPLIRIRHCNRTLIDNKLRNFGIRGFSSSVLVATHTQRPTLKSRFKSSSVACCISSIDCVLNRSKNTLDASRVEVWRGGRRLGSYLRGN